ncbi:GDSL esterase/lipase [Gossypium australe]|uniref:GDSL esterase/lipase n=1 Tax=Gossypium australe TaxID=47621 RepID=A0A5B6V8N1_9ROSI|nr:GDSL esterase/lipase [Gossypium australe]
MAKGLAFVALSLIIGVLQSANAVVPAIFILGDSTVDVGTNNYLPDSNITATFPHNGVDFPFQRATGRFSNGLSTADFLAKYFGFKRSPVSFLSLNGTLAIKKRKFRGVNFASAGSGLLDITGQTSTQKASIVPMGEQVYQFSMVYNDLVASKGTSEAQNFLAKFLIFISVGSNDIVGNHYSRYPIPKEQFIPNLANLISVGARKFGITSVPPVGCCPSQRVSANGECLKELNDQAEAFFSTMDTIMRNLSYENKDIKYSLGNAFNITKPVIDNPQNSSFTDVKNACCGKGTLPCTPLASLCSNRHKYWFWDLFHPTQDASRLAASILFIGDSRFATPISFSQLAEA